MSNLSAFGYIQERSEATPGLFNLPLSIISANIAALDSGLTSSSPSGNTFSFLTNIETSGGAHFQYLSVGSTPPSVATTAGITVAVNSNQSDYLYLVDSSGQRSSYLLGSRAGGSGDGLNLWDVSGQTLIVNFAKQRISTNVPISGSLSLSGSTQTLTLGGPIQVLGGTINSVRITPQADDTNSQIYGSDSTNANLVWDVNNRGDAAFRTVVATVGGLRATTAFLAPDGLAIFPPLTFVSEQSLGLFRSAASVLALSYGTLAIGSGVSIAHLSMVTNGSGATIVTDTGGIVYSPFVVTVVPPSTNTQQTYAAIFQMFAGAQRSAGAPLFSANEKVALYAEAARNSGRTDLIWAAAFASITSDVLNNVIGVEIDVDNQSGTDASGVTALDGLTIVSGGNNAPRTALSVTAGGSGAAWLQGLSLASIKNIAISILTGAASGLSVDPGVTVGIDTQSPVVIRNIPSNALRITPAADNANTQIYGTNAANGIVLWSVNGLGNALFNAVTSSNNVAVGNQVLGNDGYSGAPSYSWSNEPLLGIWRSATSTVAMSRGTLDLTLALTSLATSLHTVGTAINPAWAFASDASLGMYRSGVQTIAVSYGTFDLTATIASLGTIRVKSGANNSCGTAVLGSNGSVNVANTYVKTGDLIFLTDQSPGGTLGDLELGGIRNSSGFTIQSTSLTDTSTVGWLIIRPG